MNEFALKELEVIGEYPTVGTYYGYEQPVVSKLNTPITPRKNFELFFSRKPFCWVPDIMSDVNYVYPYLMPDNLACSFEGGFDAFGVKWIPDTSCPDLPSFVEPGFVKMPDIENWRDLAWPDIENWDWEGGSKEYKEKLDKDRWNCGIMLSGQFERMISLMTFASAAEALIMDPDNVHAFLDKLLEYNIKILEHYKKYLDVDMVIFHDDWGAQKAPFFSGEMVEEFFVPRLKKLVDRAHSLGVIFELHSCGNITSFVPYMIEAGVDIWQYNTTAVLDTVEDTIRVYGDRIQFESDLFTEAETKEGIQTDVDDLHKRFSVNGASATTIWVPPVEGIDMRGFMYQKSREFAQK